MTVAEGVLTLHTTGSDAAFEPLEVQEVVPEDSPSNPAGGRVHIAARRRSVRSGTTCDPGCIDRVPDAGWVWTPRRGQGVVLRPSLVPPGADPYFVRP
jgi:hypothetical protein